MNSKVRSFLGLITVVLSINSAASTFTQDVAVNQALDWMKDNPVMGAVERNVEKVSKFPDAGYGVYIVELSPKGYLVLNSDEHLPLIVAFSSDSLVDLRDIPQNAFRAMLCIHASKMTELLADPDKLKTVQSSHMNPLAVTELHGPFLETSWNQCNPYNKFCPDNPWGSEYYDYRSPSGCVPTAYSQVMNFHRWPVYGTGMHSYTDNSGNIQGPHSAAFSDTYDWGSMQNSYDPYATNPDEEEDAVAELMYELGVAVEANFETNYTSAATQTLGSLMDDYFFYEECETYASLITLQAPLEADLRAGFPCIVAVPGHAVVADGLMVDSGVTTYHINYGWGGTNNGWWEAGNVAGSALDEGVTSIRPQLLAFPNTGSVTGVVDEALELQWILPKRLETEADTLTIYSLEQQAGSWNNDAASLPEENNGWTLSSAGRNGDCWFAGPYGPDSMILDEVLVPDETTTISFWTFYKLGTSAMTLSVSTDDGESFSPLLTLSNYNGNDWERKSASLSTYAGQQVRLRFELSSGSYYPGGGIWIDDLSVSSGSWLNWETFYTDTTLAARRFSSVESAIDDCDDFSVFAKTTASANKNWICTSYGDVDSCFYKEPLGDWVDYDLTSVSTITPSASSRLVFRTRHWLGDDVLSLKVSTDGSSYTELWSTSENSDWHNAYVDLSAYQGVPVYLRFTYNFSSGSYYPSGGVWIDWVKMEDVTNPELEGQPIHYTTIPSPPAGVHTLRAVITDTSMVDHSKGPAFTLSVYDNDGMPTWWEELYSLDPFSDDSGLDPDLDTFSNGDEFICGTHPGEGGSFFAADITGSTISWPAIPDRTYRIWYADQLTNTWQVLQTLQGPTDNFTDNSGAPSRFYKVDVAR